MREILVMWGCGLVLTQVVASGDPGAAKLEQRTQSFRIVLNGSVADVTPLFGPAREAEWAPSWRPHFVQPADGGQHEGVVFTTASASGRERLWLLTAYDVKEGRVEYVFVTPGFTANEIKIQVVAEGERKCQATVTYRHSALATEGNQEVAKLDTLWAEQQRVHWQTAINALLAKGATHE
ncbi:MAG TPA: hypothetical protein VNW72_07755 [Chthoniobacterales bacterium]|nr:hypothetical protein [Chthoniobacterales bacterium]